MQISVSEIFGPTIQGEGPSLGEQAVFLRLGMCNLKCTWCDTKYTWDWTQYNKHEMTYLDSVDKVREHVLVMQSGTGAHLLVITGGEPMLQQKALRQLLDDEYLRYSFPEVEVETNGTIAPGLLQDVTYNVSPKLINSGDWNTAARRITPALWAYVALPNARFKFVCNHITDLYEVLELCRKYCIANERVWIMPLGTSDTEVQHTGAYLADEAIRLGFNMTTRLHVMYWGNQRGR